MKRVLSLISILLCMSLFLTGCGGEKASTEAVKSEDKKEESGQKTDIKDIKAGFLYVGPIGDGGWTYAHNEGRLVLEKELGIETKYVEAVPETEESEKVMENMIKEGCNVIFATSYGFGPYVKNVAKNHPEVVFLHCSGIETAENIGTYYGKMIEPRYLSGIVAGKATKTNKIGFVGAFPIPEIIRQVNAFTLGAKSVNPDVEVHVVWTYTWYDPVLERQSAEDLLDLGCDVMAQDQDTSGPVQAAEERGVYSSGYNTDMSSLAPNGYLVSPVWNWGVYYKNVIAQVADKTWTSKPYWEGMNQDIVKLSQYGKSVSDEVKTMIEKNQQDIMSGSLKIFKGPLKNNKGELKVEDGKVMTDDEVWNMDWLIEGVVGEVK